MCVDLFLILVTSKFVNPLDKRGGFARAGWVTHMAAILFLKKKKQSHGGQGLGPEIVDDDDW